VTLLVMCVQGSCRLELDIDTDYQDLIFRDFFQAILTNYLDSYLN
jgi:hypothetical protein